MANPFSTMTLPQRSPDIIVHGDERTAPSDATVMVDSGPLFNNLYPVTGIVVEISSDDALTPFEIAHRNAANDTDLDVAYVSANQTPGSWEGYFACANGERIVVRNKGAGTSAKVYQVSMYVYTNVY